MKCTFFHCKFKEGEFCSLSESICEKNTQNSCFSDGCKHCKDVLDCEIHDKIINFSEKKKEKAKKTVAENLPCAYEDGSFNPLTNTYGYGVVFVDAYGESPLKGSGSEPTMAVMRNVAGEISGAMAAIEHAKKLGYTSLTIFYDYKGIECWVTGEWAARKEHTQRYKEFCKTCGIQLQFKHIKAHSGNKGNEKADILAKRAVGL